MSAIVKGTASTQLVRQELRYDAQSDNVTIENEYHGSVRSALGMFARQRGYGNNVTATIDGGTGRVVIQTPTAGEDAGEEGVQYTERYEVKIEFLEKEIWQVPNIAMEARRYNSVIDATGSESDPYYREAIEQAAVNKLTFTIDPVVYPYAAQVIRYVRDGVTGWETEYVVVSRSRRIPRASYVGQSTAIATIGEGQYVYTTNQLQLPYDVSFRVPDSTSLTPISSDYIWGWRRRPSTSTIEGQFIDQTSEFILSQWSSLFYTQSSSDAAW